MPRPSEICSAVMPNRWELLSTQKLGSLEEEEDA
jgi:hypothetical protein